MNLDLWIRRIAYLKPLAKNSRAGAGLMPGRSEPDYVSGDKL